MLDRNIRRAESFTRTVGHRCAEWENSETTLGDARAMPACGKELILVVRDAGLSECLFLARSASARHRSNTAAFWGLADMLAVVPTRRK